jgi:hypothetical protein
MIMKLIKLRKSLRMKLEYQNDERLLLPKTLCEADPQAVSSTWRYEAERVKCASFGHILGKRTRATIFCIANLCQDASNSNLIKGLHIGVE